MVYDLIECILYFQSVISVKRKSIKHQPCQSNSRLALSSASLCSAVTMATGDRGPALSCRHTVCNGSRCINVRDYVYVCLCVCCLTAVHTQDTMLRADSAHCVYERWMLACVPVRVNVNQRCGKRVFVCVCELCNKQLQQKAPNFPTLSTEGRV